MLKADLHIHTTFSPDSTITPERLVERCLELGINCIAVTEHNSLAGALAVAAIAPFKVIPAEEVKSTEGEIIGLFLQEEIPARLTPEETVARIKAQGGLVCLPHPFDRVRREPLKPEARGRILPQIDIVEILNARTTFKADNAHARAFALEHGLAMSAGSDAHSPGEIGRAYVELAEFESPAEFLASLREGRVGGRISSPLVHVVSSWAKVRRRLRGR